MDWVKPPDNLLWRWSVSFVERLEGGCYHEFIRQDLPSMLAQAGLHLLAYDEADTIGMFLLSTRP
ncbi:hypothetical protein [Desulfotomaculum copahuensis]|uniref:Uncharacterized protein n=1 Tax=Desulfotomaculum copahuensis TaxID=1838280 RepID=A0A1B7LAD0_9FIRM|nr:hypothetical protein [Desulfotomaculum copahuensis]OAT79285.1 hypothetical protein A6M21_16390 [Desulfotomaculum copahuensis]